MPTIDPAHALSPAAGTRPTKSRTGENPGMSEQGPFSSTLILICGPTGRVRDGANWEAPVQPVYNQQPAAPGAMMPQVAYLQAYAAYMAAMSQQQR